MRGISFALLLLLPCGLSAQPERIVSTSGTLTEIVCALGADNRLVAVDSSSVYPELVTQLPQVGYSRQLSAEGILSVHADLVLLSEEAGPPAVLDQLKRLQVPLVTLPEGHTVEEAAKRIELVGEAIGSEEKGRKLAANLRRQLEQTARDQSEQNRPKVLFLYARGGGVMNVSGTDTAADSMIHLAGGVNSITDYTGYKPLTAEGAVAAAPDVILVTERGLEASGGVAGLLSQPGLSMTPAGRNRRIVAMDDLLLLGFGPRLGQAVEELSLQLQPVLARTDRP